MIPVAMPDLTGNEKKYLDDCIDTAVVSSVGEYVTKFECMVAKATGSMYAVATSAGTTGLHAALTAVGVRQKDLVILPTFTFIASANAVAHCGAKPWLMDINATDWCMDPLVVQNEIEANCIVRDGCVIHRATGYRVAALMPVYTLGNIPDMAEFRRLADLYGLPLIVDAACAIGAEYRGHKFGELADLSVLSFNGNKTITCGGGGAVVGNYERLLNRVRHLTTTARVWPDYDFDMVGFNYRMTNIQAAVGVAQMERMPGFIEKKRMVRMYYERSLAALQAKGVTFFPTTEGSSCWLSGIVLPEGGNLDAVKVICRKLKACNIEARPFWKPVHLQVPYRNCPRGGMTVAESFWQRILTLPCSTNIKDWELSYIVKCIQDIEGDRVWINEHQF